MARTKGFGLGVVFAVHVAACTESAAPPEPPDESEIQELADKSCTQTYTCYDYGTGEEEAELLAECKAEQAGLPDLMFGDVNAGCEDVWLVFEYHDCRASLGCADDMLNAEYPGNPCHDELMEARDAKCRL